MPQSPRLWCAVCSAVMHQSKGSLPQGEATCHGCRRKLRAERLSLSRSHCLNCGDSLTEEQRKRAGSYCSVNCAYKDAAVPEPAQRDYSRRRLSCTIRPVFPRGTDEPYVSANPPSPDEADWLHGPGRERFLIVRDYHDGRTRSRCLFCWAEQPYADERVVWCPHCAVLVSLTHARGVTPKRSRPRTRR